MRFEDFSTEKNNPKENLHEGERRFTHISPESFLEQLSEESTLEIVDEEHHACALISYTEIIPEEPISEEYVVYVGGFGTNAYAYDAQLFEIARRGHKVIYLNPQSGITPSAELSEYAHEKQIPLSIQQKAMEVETLFKTLGIERACLIGHSQGGAIATLFSSIHAEKIDKLILDTPAGLAGHMSVRELFKRSLDEALQEFMFAYRKMRYEGDRSFLLEWSDRLYHNKRGKGAESLWKLRDDIRALVETDITPILRDIEEMKKESEGPHVVLVTSHNDRIFRSADIENKLGADPFGEVDHAALIDRWVIYADKSTGHGFLTKNDPRLLTLLLKENQGDSRAKSAAVIADCLELA